MAINLAAFPPWWGENIVPDELQIQPFITECTNTVTSQPINKILSRNTFLMYNGQTVTGTTTPSSSNAIVQIQSPSNVQIIRNSTDSIPLNAYYTLVQFPSAVISRISSLQVPLLGTVQNNLTVPTVDLSRSMVNFNGRVTNDTNSALNQCQTRNRFIDASTVAANKGTGTNNVTSSMNLVEFSPGIGVQNAEGNITFGVGTVADVTITSVDPTSTFLVYRGDSINSTRTPDVSYPYCYLLDATTVRFQRHTSNTTTTICDCAIVTVPSGIISVQRGFTTIASSQTTATSTITSVDLSRSFVSFLGFTTTETVFNPQNYLSAAYLSDDSTITAIRGNGGTGTVTVSWEVITIL